MSDSLMGLMPPSTNAAYHGSLWSAWYLTLVGLLEIAPGCIHYFLPDGGAGVIAKIDLSSRRDTIVAIFAWMGAMQIPFGLSILIVSLRYRSLVPLFLILAILQRGLMVWNGWFGKGSHGHHPPEHYGSLVAVFLGLIFLALALS
jgi:hypothetical protein